MRLNTTGILQMPDEGCEFVTISRGKFNLKFDCLKTYMHFEEAYDVDQMLAIRVWQTSSKFTPIHETGEAVDNVKFESTHLDEMSEDKSNDQWESWDYQRKVIDLRDQIGVYEYYNVMWIEWENGIAYRKAVGRVYKEAWESLDLEEVDVLLG
jgi:hypothetical protein